MSDQKQSGRQPTKQGPGIASRFTAKQGLWALLVLVALWFVFSNGQDVKVHYFFGTASTPLWLLIVISIGIGMLLDRGLIAFMGHRRRREEKRK